MVEAAGDDEKELAAQLAAEFLNEDLSEQQFGSPKAGPGMWAACLRMLDPIKVNHNDFYVICQTQEAVFEHISQH